MNPSDSQSEIRRESAEALRSLPAVHHVLAELGDVGVPRPMVVQVVRARLDSLRRSVSDQRTPVPGLESILASVRRELGEMGRGRIQSVINATGIIIHTNLGRSPLAERAVDAVSRAARDYVNLEYDIDAGRRGQRGPYVEQAL